MTRIAVIGDSVSTRNNGASTSTWPALLETMIRDGGVKGFTIDAYAIPGLTWKTAHVPTPNWLIGGTQTPVAAMRANGPYDLCIVMLGANDRNNPDALADYHDFRAALGPCNLAFVAENFTLPDGKVSTNTAITQVEAERINALYATINEPFLGVSLGKLYEMGLTYDGYHQTDTGDQWIAASVYMGLQARFGFTPIGRNIGWLYAHFLNPDQTVFRQFMKANT